MRFKVDENLPVEVAEMLRQAGHDAATVLEQHLDSVPPLHAEPPALLSAYTYCWPPDRLPRLR